MFDDYVDFCGICGDACVTPYVNFRQLVYCSDYFSRSKFERTIHETDPTVVVWTCPWEDAMKDAVKMRDFVVANKKVSL